MQVSKSKDRRRHSKSDHGAKRETERDGGESRLKGELLEALNIYRVVGQPTVGGL